MTVSDDILNYLIDINLIPNPKLTLILNFFQSDVIDTNHHPKPKF